MEGVEERSAQRLRRLGGEEDRGGDEWFEEKTKEHSRGVKIQGERSQEKDKWKRCERKGGEKGRREGERGGT